MAERSPITVRGVAYALFTRGLISSMNTNNIPTNIHGNPVNGRNSMSGPVRNASINGPMSNGSINAAINKKHDNTPVSDNSNPFGMPNRNGMENVHDNTPVSDNRNPFGMPNRNGMENVGHGS